MFDGSAQLADSVSHLLVDAGEDSDGFIEQLLVAAGQILMQAIERALHLLEYDVGGCEGLLGLGFEAFWNRNLLHLGADILEVLAQAGIIALEDFWSDESLADLLESREQAREPGVGCIDRTGLEIGLVFQGLVQVIAGQFELVGQCFYLRAE